MDRWKSHNTLATLAHSAARSAKDNYQEQSSLLTPNLGHRETHSSRHLELQLVQKGHSRRRLDSLNNCCSHRSQVSLYEPCSFCHRLTTLSYQYRSSVAGDHRGIEVSISRHHHAIFLYPIRSTNMTRMIHQHSASQSSLQQFVTGIGSCRPLSAY